MFGVKVTRSAGNAQCVTGVHAGKSSGAGVDGCCSPAVIDLVGHRETCHCQRFFRDVGRGAGLVADLVVAHIRTVVAAAQGNQLASGCVLVCKRTSAGDSDRVATDHATKHCTRRADCGTGACVIHLVGRSDAAHRQRRFADVRCGAGLVCDQVVAGVRAAVVAADRDRLAGADVLVIKAACGGKAQGVSTDQAGVHRVGGDHSGTGVAVVDLIGRRHAADAECLLAHVGCGCGCACKCSVVTHIGTA